MKIKITPPARQTILPEREIDLTKYVLIDDPVRKRVLVRYFGVPRSLVLWENEAYEQIGDWTQAQAENRITELLGENPEEVLVELFTVPNPSERLYPIR